MQIKKMPEAERPQEKMLYGGAGGLSNSELLALIIRTGTGDKSALRLADEVISYANDNTGGLGAAEVRELTEIDGIGEAKARVFHDTQSQLETAGRIEISHFDR